MYISASEQFEIVPFLALGSQSLSLSNSVISFIFYGAAGFFACCLSYIIFFLLANNNKAKIMSKITDIPGWSETMDKKTLKMHHRYIYAEIYPKGKRSAMISIDVYVSGWKDIGPASSFIKEVYANHPFVSSGVPHNLEMLGFYTVKTKNIEAQMEELGYKLFTSVAFDAFSVGRFFKSSLEGFHKKHTYESYKLSRVILLLETL